MKRQLSFVMFVLGGAILAAMYICFEYVRHGPVAMLDPAGPIAEGELQVMLLVAAFSSIVIVPVFVLLFYFAWKYRATGPYAHITHEPNWDHDSPMVEFSWWLVPSIIIVILAAVAWRTSHTLDPYAPLPGERTLTVQVVALDWKWLFIYPEEGVASINDLEIPIGVPVHFVLTADAPMNSFWIPQLGGQIMVMPGMTTQLYLEADRGGIYKGYSANISGKGFAGMAFDTRAVSEADFDAWIAAGRSAVPLDAISYAALAKPSEYNVPMQYSLSDSSLYNAVANSHMGTMQPVVPIGPNQASTTTYDMMPDGIKM